ncbi:hypothetical protein LSCM1_00044 [Leishmania martiniquensis]|uniref:Uncharacterized protein n=1 Tax=Leishmania martiniquensis TaxID=1580590 RepID=A0A836GRY6_9TRYP|nr:hypothetical protein LSCM1_00044 [Leishmania martiniquensis]
MIPGGEGSGFEPGYPVRGLVHPYVDSVPASSAPGMYSSYTGRPTFSAAVGESGAAGGSGGARAASAESFPTENEAFTKEDRMLLRLLYHQQQAIQVQLNTMMEWMQQVNYRIASLERISRHARPTAAAGATFSLPASGGGAATATGSAAPPLSHSASATEGYGSMATQLHGAPLYSSSPAISAPDAPRPQTGSGPPSVYSGQGFQRAASSAPPMSSVFESSRACTPPSEQTRRQAGGAGGGSAAQSTSRSLESAMAQPWDPHNTSLQSTIGAAVHSRTSSHTSALGRRANPLLSSSTTISKLPTSSSRLNWVDPKQLSRPDASIPSGTAQTSFSSNLTSLETQQPPSSLQQPQQSRQAPVVSPPAAAAVPQASSSLYTPADAVVPPYRRMPPESSSRQPLSRTGTGVSAAAASRAPPVSSSTAEAPVRRPAREGTLPPAQSSTMAANSNHDDAQGRAATRTTAVEDKQEVRATDSGAGATYRELSAAANPAGGPGGVARSREGEANLPPESNDDSLSDGYGSYESRMYMKSLGLL